MKCDWSPSKKILPVLTFMIVVFMSGVSLTHARDQSQIWYDEVMLQYDMANYDKAISAFERFLNLYPKSDLIDDAHYMLGKCYDQQDRFDDAIFAFYTVAHKYPNTNRADDALYTLAGSLYRKGYMSQALDVYEQLVKKYPSSEYAAYSQTSIGWLYGGLGSPQKAKAALEKVIVNYPDSSYVETARESLKKLALAPESGSSMQEMALWNSIIHSDEPADFKGYLKKYPNGVFMLIAQQKLQDLAVKSAKRPDGSHFINLAKQRYPYDLDSDGRTEEVLLVPSGENDEGQFFSLIVLDDNDGIIWSGSKVLNSQNPMVFGEWHYGISMPEVIGDIDDDGAIELLSPAPQSDISPTLFRILRWKNDAFALVRVATLLEAPSDSGRFLWNTNSQSLGVWVSSFLSTNKPGEVTVEIMGYQGGANVKKRRAELRKNAPGYEIKRWIDDKIENIQSTNLNTYRALLSTEDHFNSRGIALNDVISILRQDRANFHLNRHRDLDDESDPFFSEASARKLMKQKSVEIECKEINCEQSILNGTPLVEVTVESNSLKLRIIKRNSNKKTADSNVQIRNVSPIFLRDEMYQHYKTPAQVVYFYVAESLFPQSNVTNVGSPEIKEKQVYIDFYMNGKKEVLVFIEKSRKQNEAVVMVGPPRSDATDIYQLSKIKGRWAIVGVKHSNGMQ